MENILSGNPLLNYTSQVQKGDLKVSHYDMATFVIGKCYLSPHNIFCVQVKRRWDDDVVFKNCARSEPDKKKDQQFINDSLRSEFHRKFMEKYVKWAHALQIIQADPQLKLGMNDKNSAENTVCYAWWAFN
jgi:protein CWC15